MRRSPLVQHVHRLRIAVAGVLVALTLVPGIGAWADVVRDRLPSVPIVVDAARHRWQLRQPPGAVGALEHDADHGAGDHQRAHATAVLQLRVKLMNVTQDPAGGTVVLRVSLIGDGLEQDYLEATARLHGAQALQQTLAERGHDGPRSRAILNYLERGRDLPEGKPYEPVESAGKRYLIRLRIPVRLRAGDTVEYYYEGPVPDDQGGYRVEVDVEAIEVGA